MTTKDPYELLAEVKAIATARVKSLNVAAKHQNLALVDAGRLALLEELLAKLARAAETSAMTRDYRDVLARGGDEYDGKRFLLRRNEFQEVLRVMSSLGEASALPQGCLANDWK